MPALFHRLNIDGFGALLEAWRPSRRDIAEVHLRQTRLPGGERFDGRTTIEAAWRADMAELSLSDAAQHATVAPDGSLWTGRHWDVPVPPRSRGGQAFALSILGDFDGRDRLEGAQREAALKAIALVQDRFGLPVDALRFVGPGSPRAPPRAGSARQPA